MSSNDETIPTDTEACYEAVASLEEIYLEEVEEELRAILIFGDPTYFVTGKYDQRGFLFFEGDTGPRGVDKLFQH